MRKDIVVKHNDFIEASCRLGKIEAKILLCLMAKIKRDDQDFKDYFIPVKELTEKIKIGDRNYTEVRKASRNLLSKTAVLEQSEGELEINLLSSAKYYTKGLRRGIIRFRFDPALKPYLLQLKKNFTSYHLETALNLSSVYSIRLYELLKQYKGLGKRKISLEELREILGIRKTEYKLYGHFKTRILVSAQRELKKKTDITFEFEEIKQARRITDLQFFIYENKEKEPEVNLFEHFLVEKMKKVVVFSLSRMREIIEKYNDEKIEIALKYTKEKARENKEGYFLELLKDPNFGEEEIRQRKLKEKKAEKENQEYIQQMEEEAKQAEEKKKIDAYIQKHPEYFEKLVQEFKEINAQKLPDLSQIVKESLAKNYARVEILKEIKENK